LNSGNDAYDLMLLVPPTLVHKNGGFSGMAQFEQNGFSAWDGTNKNLLRLAPAETSEHRMLQYASCRGLEAWTVVCFAFDDYIRHTAHFASEEVDDFDLSMSSHKEKTARCVGLRAIIPLTRAIDTLVITITDWDSPEAIILRNLASRSKDWCTILE
jgi:hypothetical protein